MASNGDTSLSRLSIRSVSGTDRASWNERAARLHQDLRGPARGLVRRAYGATFSDDELDDIYANAWVGTLRALARRHRDLSDDEIRSYVLTAVANHAGKEIRRRRRKPIAPLEAAGAVVEAGRTPEEAAAAGEATRITRDLLASLPPRRRAVMLLRYGWGLNPNEICGMVDGLSPRAYRKEITRGVEELTRKVKMLDEGRWCAEREPLLKAYASGLADGDQALQARRHIEHCRPCAEFVGKLSSHLHDLGSAVALPGTLEALDGHSGIVDRATALLDRGEAVAARLLGRGDGAGELLSAAGASRGAGAAGAGIAAKLAGLGAAGKAAVACIAGGAAATACIATGVVALPAATPTKADVMERPANRATRSLDPLEHVPPVPEPIPVPSEPQEPAPTPPPDSEQVDQTAADTEEPLAPTTPPTEQEFGVASAARPTGTSATTSGSSDSGSGGGAVTQEFGP